jgi:hypothetical protein
MTTTEQEVQAPKYMAPAQGLDSLCDALAALQEASQFFLERHEDQINLGGFTSHAIGGLAQTVENLIELLVERVDV